ncbi:MAG: transglycosylase domain-containing protein, partial [Bacteroidota bacterium]
MLKRIFKITWKLFVFLAILLGLLFAAIYYDVFGHLYSVKELKNFKNETASLILAENGEIIGKYFAENRTNISYDQLPQHLINALIATEDVRYFEHEGVDSRSFMRVIFKSILLQQKSSGGGSTITQQLAKNMYGRSKFGPLSMPINKTKEIILANRLENIYSKEDILTLYLNTIPFGENVMGIEAAARRFFNKSTENLKIEEAAVLVGMLKANTYYNPRLYPENASRRRNIVLDQMEKYDYLDEITTDSIQKLPIKLDYANLESEGPANYFLVQVKNEVNEILKTINKKSDSIYDIRKSGLIITTTLNLTMQNYALKAYKSHLSKMQKRLRNQYNSGIYKKDLQELVKNELKKLNLIDESENKKNREMFSWNGFYTDSISIRDSIKHDLTMLHAGLLAMDPNTGSVKTWVGGIDFRTQPYDQIFAQRQVASTFKPILYATALEKGVMPCQYLENDSIVLTDFDNWTPQNYNKSTGGKYSVAAALAKSMNIPTLNLFLQIPFEDVENTWKKLGFSQELVNKPSVALGTANASIYELSIAYATFANGGKSITPQLITSIKTTNGEILYKNRFVQSQEEIIDKQSTHLMNAILQKAIIEGTGKSMNGVYGITLPLAGKTGTSQDYADAWFAAYNPKLIIVTRVGASLPSVHFNAGNNGSGSTLALPLVAKTLQGIQKNSTLKRKYSANFQSLPENLNEALACEDYLEDSDFEKFFEGIFGKHETTADKASKKALRKAKKKNKESFFKRIFG